MFVRLKGRNGVSAEFLGLVAPASTLSVITKPDAFKLGFHEVAYANPITPSLDLLTVAGSSSMLEGAKIALQVLIGNFAIDGVEFIAYDIPQGACYDLVLGASLLKHFKTSVDYMAHTVTMEFLVAGREKNGEREKTKRCALNLASPRS